MIGTQLSLLIPKRINNRWYETIEDFIVGLHYTDLTVKITTLWWDNFLDGYIIYPQEGLTITEPIRFGNLLDAQQWATDNYHVYDFDVDSNEEDLCLVVI